MLRFLVLLFLPLWAWAGCVVVQVSPSHRDISCSSNPVVRDPRPTTITTYVTVPFPPPETQRGYYPTRVVGTVAGGQYVPPRQSYGWAEGASWRNRSR